MRIKFIDEIVEESKGTQTGIILDAGGSEWVMPEFWDSRTFRVRLKHAWEVFRGRAYAHRYMKTKADVQESRDRGRLILPGKP